MRKVHSDAEAALAGLLHDDMTIVAGGFGLCGIPENLIDAIVAERRQGPDGRQQQLRRRRLGPGQAARPAADQEDDQLLRRREQGVRAAVSGRRGRGRVQPARHAWPSASAPAAPASRPSSPRPASAPWSPRARSTATSTARPTSWSAASSATSPSSRRGRATTRATSSTGRPRGTSIRWRRPPARCAWSRSRSWSSRGELDPDHIHTPGIYVDRIIQGRDYEKRIEQRTTRKRAA